MGLRSLIALVSVVSVVWLGACDKPAQKVQPETRGKRGETCLARNDCDTGLACLNGICAKNEFNITVTAKQCTRVECSEDKDCCGTRATSAPAKCKGRESICNPQNQFFPGCANGATCTTATAETICKGGSCTMGICSGSGQIGDECETAVDCPAVANTCTIVGVNTFGSCSLTGAYCDAITPCLKPIANCSARRCDCVNPDYDPLNPICADTDCEDICLLRCQDSLCLEDKSCKTDAECLAIGLQVCDGGRCVECTADADCDADADETCESGACHKPCKQNEECGLFEECNKKGDCVYVGCQTDKECILAASRSQVVTGGNPGQNAAPVTGGDDPRLYKCLASEAGSAIKSCKIPCENDGSCGQFQVCDQGYCKFVGCDTDEECRAYLGISNQMTSESKPYVATAKCEAAPEAAASTP